MDVRAKSCPRYRFIPLGFLMLPLVINGSSNLKVIKLVAVAVIVGLTVSLIIEALQYFWIPGRYSSAYDLVANTFGAMSGAMGYVVICARRLYPRKSNQGCTC